MVTVKPPVKEGKSGGGGLGGILGAIGGLVAAPFTGGASLAATAGLIGAGAGIGSTVGNAVAPGKSATPIGGPDAEGTSAMQRRLSDNPNVGSESAILADSLEALKEAPPEVQQKYGEPLKMAYQKSMGRFS